MSEELVHRSVKLAMQVGVSIFSLVFAAIILGGKHDISLKHAASGWIGVVIGYWLK